MKAIAYTPYLLDPFVFTLPNYIYAAGGAIGVVGAGFALLN